MKILVIDDDLQIRKLLTLALSVHGYSVTTRNDAEQGMAAFATETFDLVLTDIGLPGSDGNALAQFVLDSTSPVPVVALTGVVDKATAPFDRVLGKPFYTRNLVDVISELLQKDGA